MPPVRWKLSIVTIVCLLQAVSCAYGQIRQEDVSTDGWKPIVGTRKPDFYEVVTTDSSDFYKYDVFSTPSPTVTALPPTATPGLSRKPPVFRGSPKPPYFLGRKIPHQKHNSQPDPFFALPTHERHGPHIPLGAVVHTRPSQIGLIKQHATSSRPLNQVTPTSRRNVKPVRVQTSTSNYRDDIFTAAASANHNQYKPHGSNIRTRETIDLALPGANHYSINQPHAHIDFTNRFALPSPTSESVFEHYNNPSIPSFVFGKHQHSNDINYQIQIQNDEFTRNLIPPPHVFKTKDQISRGKPNENVVLQSPPTFQFNSQKIHETPVQVQVTKEKLHEFHNNIPPSYHAQYIEYDLPVRKPSTPQYELSGVRKPTSTPQFDLSGGKRPITQFDFSSIRKPTDTPQYEFSKIRKPTVASEYDFSKIRNPTAPPKPVYEVTENKDWEEQPTQQTVQAKQSAQAKRRPSIDENLPVFLPTPYKPEKPSVEPTSPTQSEVSTIFTKLSQLQREKEVTTPNPFDFNTKEVSTHYPVFGKPIFNDLHSSQEISNEITTLHEGVETTTKEPERIRPQRRRRPDHRRRTTTTTTEPPVEDVQKMQESEETERPIRIRRPTRYRTTTPPTSSEETSAKINRGRNRYRNRNTENMNYEPTRLRTRPPKIDTTTIHPDDHKTEEEYYRESSQQVSVESEEAASERSEEVEEVPNSETVELELPERHYATELPKRVRYETIRPFIIITTTERAPTTNLDLPENEVDDATSVASVEETTTTTTAPTTTATTTTTTTANPYRIRGRPIKFDNSNRPRFSVKDYRQKLYQQSTTSTPEPPRTTDSVRIRMPSRLRRPSSTTPANNDEESTDVRSKFVPKEPRHHSTTESTNAAIITEKNIKSVNTRLRPFGRYKSTTAATTAAPKVSIKPNLFTRKRPPMLTLRSKILNRYHKNDTEPTTEKITTTTEVSDVKETTEEDDEEPEVEVTSTTDSILKSFKTTEENVDAETTTIGDISKIDPYFYSQRVSDLTSSAKNDYNTPGLFKSVSPTSRRIPNYFTIATDDPILPIEAFFPSIKEKMKDS